MTLGRILFVDNDPAFCATRKEFLESEGYDLLAMDNPAKARAYLQKTWIHLAIIDLRLVDEGDDRDVSGLTLVRQTDPVIPKIVLTAYPTWEDVRTALGPAAEGLPPAVDFVAKADGPAVMLRAVEKAFEERVKIDRDLDIQFQDSLSFPGIVSALKEDLGDREILERSREVEDLWRKLFPGYTRVVAHGFSVQAKGVAAMQVTAISTRGTDRFALRCGARNDIAAALEQSTQRPIYEAHTLHYSALVYKTKALQGVTDRLPVAGKILEALGTAISLARIFFDL